MRRAWPRQRDKTPTSFSDVPVQRRSEKQKGAVHSDQELFAGILAAVLPSTDFSHRCCMLAAELQRLLAERDKGSARHV